MTPAQKQFPISLRFRIEPRSTLRSKYLLFFLLILMAVAFVEKAVIPLAIVGFYRSFYWQEV